MRVMVVGLTKVSATAAPSAGGMKVPALAIIVAVRLAPISTSAKVTADKSILDKVSSVIVMTAGVFDTVGASFIEVVVITVVALDVPLVASAGVKVKVVTTVLAGVT